MRHQERRDVRHLPGVSLSDFINAKPGRPTEATRRLAQVLRRD